MTSTTELDEAARAWANRPDIIDMDEEVERLREQHHIVGPAPRWIERLARENITQRGPQNAPQGQERISTFTRGDRVVHRNHGSGTVLMAVGDTITVQFDGCGQRTSLSTFLSRLPSLKAGNQNDQRAGKFIVTRFRDLGKSKPKPFVVKGVRAAGEASYTVAKPGGGKSVIEGDIAYHIATGREWHGHKVDAGLAVYIAAERRSLQERRMMALRKHYGDEDVDVPLVVIGGKPNLTDDKRTDATTMVQLIKELEKEYSLPCRHITIDTLARSFGGKNQNATEDMSRFVHNIDLVMESVPTAHVNIVHHEGWETGRAKGSIDLDGAVDASFQVRKSGGIYTLACDGANDGLEGDILSFTMQSVTLGVDDDGEPITAPVVVKSVDVAGFAANTKTVQAKAEEDAMSIITELAAGGHSVGGGMWLAKFRETDPDVNERTMQSRWQRAVRALEGAGRVSSSGSPKVYTLVEMQDANASEMHASDAFEYASNDQKECEMQDANASPPLGGCLHASAFGECGVKNTPPIDDFDPDRDVPAFLRKAA